MSPRPPFAHMGRADTILWNSFTDANPDLFTNPTYDLHVGEGANLPDNMPEPYRTMALTLSQKKIDVFAYHAGRPYIIELKPYPGTAALGQLLSYKHLYERMHPTDVQPSLCLICCQLDDDIMGALLAHNVWVIVHDMPADAFMDLAFKG